MDNSVEKVGANYSETPAASQPASQPASHGHSAALQYLAASQPAALLHHTASQPASHGHSAALQYPAASQPAALLHSQPASFGHSAALLHPAVSQPTSRVQSAAVIHPAATSKEPEAVLHLAASQTAHSEPEAAVLHPAEHSASQTANGQPSSQQTEASKPETKPQRQRRRQTGAAKSARPKSYCIRYENNGSEKWDGSEILLGTKYMESLYDKNELVPGKAVELPWETNGETEIWKGVIVELSSKKPDTPGKLAITELTDQVSYSISLTLNCFLFSLFSY